MILIFQINYYQLIDKFQKLFQRFYQSISKIPKTQISKIIQSARFLGRLLGPLPKTRLHSMKNGLQPLARSVLIPLGSKAAGSAADAAIHKKILGSGTATIIISNEEMKDIVKMVKFLEDAISSFNQF